MLYYNWQRIFRAAKQKPSECIRIARALTFNTIPWGLYDPLYKYNLNAFIGESYLSNPIDLLNSRYSKYDICIYMAIASQRSLASYLLSKDTTLELIHSRVDPTSYLRDDSLLWVDKGIIHFKFEE